MDKFSVLISVYKKESPSYFTDSLESVFNQTLMPDEVVIVEDGPLTPELDLVVDAFVSKYPDIMKVVKFSLNRGLGPALADGIKECSHDIIVRMDSDDICLPDRFEKLVATFKNKDVSIVSSNIVEYDEKMEHALKCKVVPETDLEIKKFLKQRSPFNHMAVAFLKNDVLEVGNYENVPYFEDYHLWCKMMKTKKGYNIQDNLVNVRAGDEMFKRRGGLNYVKCIINFQSKIYKMGIISFAEFIVYTIGRIVVSIIPNSLRKFIYNVFLRAGVKNEENC